MFLIFKASRRDLVPSQPSILGVPVTIFPGIRLPGHEANISPRCSGKVQNACSCMSISLSFFMATKGTNLSLRYMCITIDIK